MSEEALKSEIDELRRRLQEAEETIAAIQEGAVDALVVEKTNGAQIYSLDGADRPYRILVEQMQQGAATLQEDGTIIYGNKQLADLLKTPLEKLFGATLRDFVDTVDLANYDNLLWQGQTRSGRGEARLRRTDGGLVSVYLTFNALPKESGATIGVLVTDLTAQRHHERLAAALEKLQQSEAALRESEVRFRTMADNIAQLAWTCERLGDVTWYNQRWLDYTGLTFDETRDWGWKQVQHPEHVDRVVASVTRSRNTGEVWEDTFPLRGKDGIYRWFLSRAVPVRDAAGNVVRWFGTNTDVSELRDAEARQQILINELNHRVKNTLATVQSIAAQTFRAGNLDPSVRENFEARLLSLANAHSILTQESWEGAEIHDILARSLRPHAEPERLSLHGPPIRLSPKAALAISMGMHELATNAVKYGALSNGTGKVVVTWTIDGPLPGILNLQWKENGGPRVSAPNRKGFGSRLIERNLAHDLDGEAKIDYRPDGVICTIISTLESARETDQGRFHD